MGNSEFGLGHKAPSGSEVADWIRNQIRIRRFVPGQRLVEIDIIRKTGGSRFKVREALQRLHAEGLVDIEEFRGASVRNASMEEVRQLYRARGALEGICAAEFVRRSTPEQRAKLNEIAQAMERAVEQGIPESFGSLNAAWHRLILEGSGNTVIRDLIQRLNTPIHHLLFETFYRPERLRAATVDHRRIIDAIDRSDPDAAEKAMREHVENGLAFLQKLDNAVHFDEQTG